MNHEIRWMCCAGVSPYDKLLPHQTECTGNGKPRVLSFFRDLFSSTYNKAPTDCSHARSAPCNTLISPLLPQNQMKIANFIALTGSCVMLLASLNYGVMRVAALPERPCQYECDCPDGTVCK
ncbi:hypothetical protein DL93DRAFT_1857613 [Clavulina sp. PMI_390]|nr:hypothetical protein DL93DRAFT_1857613 [Clavulina sp. PMI_390]